MKAQVQLHCYGDGAEQLAVYSGPTVDRYLQSRSTGGRLNRAITASSDAIHTTARAHRTLIAGWPTCRYPTGHLLLAATDQVPGHERER